MKKQGILIVLLIMVATISLAVAYIKADEATALMKKVETQQNQLEMCQAQAEEMAVMAKDAAAEAARAMAEAQKALEDCQNK